MHKPLAIAIVMAGLLGLSPTHAQQVKQSADSSVAITQNPLPVGSLADLTASRERPLFSPGRRPPAPPAVADAEQIQAPPEPPALLFFGVVTDQNGARAIVRSDASGPVKSIRVGEDVSGWTVETIEPRHLTLTREGRSAAFALFDRDKQVVSTPSPSRVARVLEVNAAGVLRSRRVNSTP